MGCSTPACAECTQNCLMIHGKKDPSPIISSFFKVMVGDKFSKVLSLPPKFARTVSNLIDQKTQLEDASGQRWTVTLSKCDGSLAFQEGWPSFSQEHGLEVGDFAVFHYIMGSHFVVQIYGKSGCEKLIFHEENGIRRKRPRTNRNSSAKDGKYRSKHNSSTSDVPGSNVEISRSQPMVTLNNSNIDDGNGSLQPVPRTISAARDAAHQQKDQRNSLSDLSNSEMPRTFGVEGTDRVLETESPSCPGRGNEMPKSQAGVAIADKIPVTEKAMSSVALSNIPDSAIHKRNEDFQMTETVETISKKDFGNGNGNTSEQEQRSKKQSSKNKAFVSQNEDTPLTRSRSQSSQQKFAGMADLCRLPASFQTLNPHYEEKKKVAKQEEVKVEMSKEIDGYGETVNGKYPEIKECVRSSNHAINDNDPDVKLVKNEPVDTFELSTDAVNTPILVVADKQPFLELPSYFPSVSFKGRPRMEKRVVVLLRDPVSRLWPVLYHEKYGIKVLVSGWEAFVKANSIQPGDECNFGVENVLECIYQVSIVRK